MAAAPSPAAPEEPSDSLSYRKRDLMRTISTASSGLGIPVLLYLLTQVNDLSSLIRTQAEQMTSQIKESALTREQLGLVRDQLASMRREIESRIATGEQRAELLRVEISDGKRDLRDLSQRVIEMERGHPAGRAAPP
jgi:hypothetical protein